MDFRWAIFAPFVGAGLYHVSYRGIICLHIDDAVNAGAIHGLCGYWGVLVGGFAVIESTKLDAGYPGQDVACTPVNQFLVNFLFGSIVLLWVRVSWGTTDDSTFSGKNRPKGLFI